MPVYPGDLDIPPFQLRRALATTVSNYVAAAGEPVWATDTKTLYVGDGTTVGGIAVAGEGYTATNVVTSQLINGTWTVSLEATGEVSFPNYTFPVEDGLAGQVLETDGTGVLTWTTASSGPVNPFDQDLNTTDSVTFANLTVTNTATLSSIHWTGNPVAIGKNASAPDQYPYASGVAIGDTASATGRSSLAFGRVSNASESNTTAIGAGSSANQTGATAVGSNSVASNFYTVAVGTQANASGLQSLAVGTTARAEGDYSVGIGSYSKANANESIVINASSGTFTTSTQSGFYVNPVRANTTTNILYYDSTTKEISYGINYGSDTPGNPFDQTLNTSDTVRFAEMQLGDNTSALSKMRFTYNTSTQNLNINNYPGYGSAGNGNDSVVIGNYAGGGGTSVALGMQALMGQAGSNNIGIGFRAGKGLYGTSENNTIIGNLIDNESGDIDSFSNTLLLGAGSSERLRINSTSTYVSSIRNSTSTQVLYYDTTTKEVMYGAAPASGSTYDQSLNTTDNVTFKSLGITSGTVLTKTVSVGGMPVDGNGQILMAQNSAQSPALLVSNYAGTATRSAIWLRSYGQNLSGGTATTSPSPALQFDGARGTPGSPTAVQTNDVLMALSAGGYDGTNWTGNAAGGGLAALSSAQIIAAANENWAGSASTTTNAGARIFIRSQPSNMVLNNTSRQIVFNQGWSAATTTSPARAFINFGNADNSTPTLTHSNNTTTFTGYGSSDFQIINAKNYIYGVPAQDTAPDNASLTATNYLMFATGRRSGSSGRRNTLQSGDDIGSLLFYGQTANNATGIGSQGAYISAKTLENWSGSARGTQINIGTANSGTTTVSQRLQLDNKTNFYLSDQHSFYTTGYGTTLANFRTDGASIKADSISLQAQGGTSTFAVFSGTGVAVGNGSAKGTITAGGVQNLRLQTSNSPETAAIELDSTYVNLYAGADGNTTVATFSTGSVSIQAPLDISGQYIYGSSSNEIDLYESLISVGDGSSTASIKSYNGYDLELATHANQPLSGGSITIRNGAGNGVDIYANGGTNVANFNTTAITITAPVDYEDFTRELSVKTNGLNTGDTVYDILTFDPAVYASAKVVIMIKDGGMFHSAEMLIVSDGTDVYSTEYAALDTAGILGTFNAVLDSGLVKLQITTISGISNAHATVKATLMAV